MVDKYNGTMVGEITNIQVTRDDAGGFFGFIIFKHEGTYTHYSITSDFVDLANKLAGRKIKLGYTSSHTAYELVTSMEPVGK